MEEEAAGDLNAQEDEEEEEEVYEDIPPPEIILDKTAQEPEDTKVYRLSFSPSNLDVACKLRVPKDNILNPIFKCYCPTIQTQKLSSERHRKIFAEAFCIDDDQYKQYTNQVPKLVDLSLEALVAHYKRGNANYVKDPVLREKFGEKLSTNLLLMDIIDLDIQSFWKKVFFEICPDKLLKCKKKRSAEGDWKCLGIQQKFRDLVEKAKYEEWDDEKMAKFTKVVSNCIDTLVITHLEPLKEYSIERNAYLPNDRIRKTPAENCHHINLEFLGELKNLTVLHIEFQPPLVGFNYESRIFNFSYRDTENLIKALGKLSQLKAFTLRRSKMDNRKLVMLVNVLPELKMLESVDFSYCDLKDESGYVLSQLFNEQKTIKSLELAGNNISALGIYSLMYGVQNYEGFLEYLGLARNPIHEEGVVALSRAINNSKQVTHLDLTGIIVSQYGASLVAEFIKCKTELISLEMCAIPLKKQGGNRLVKNLKTNTKLLHLECHGCKMTENQLYKVALLLERNNYIKLTSPVTSLVHKSPEERKELDKGLDKWVVAPKNPIILRANQIYQKKKECKESEEKFTDIPLNIPIFIPKVARKEILNNDLLFGEYYEIDEESEPFVFDPSNFTEEEILQHCNTLGA